MAEETGHQEQTKGHWENKKSQKMNKSFVIMAWFFGNRTDGVFYLSWFNVLCNPYLGMLNSVENKGQFSVSWLSFANLCKLQFHLYRDKCGKPSAHPTCLVLVKALPVWNIPDALAIKFIQTNNHRFCVIWYLFEVCLNDLSR